MVEEYSGNCRIGEKKQNENNDEDRSVNKKRGTERKILGPTDFKIGNIHTFIVSKNAEEYFIFVHIDMRT